MCKHSEQHVKADTDEHRRIVGAVLNGCLHKVLISFPLEAAFFESREGEKIG